MTALQALDKIVARTKQRVPGYMSKKMATALDALKRKDEAGAEGVLLDLEATYGRVYSLEYPPLPEVAEDYQVLVEWKQTRAPQLTLF